MSLPSRERGLKWRYGLRCGKKNDVAPFAGAWIEIIRLLSQTLSKQVAPFAGAWIEI